MATHNRANTSNLPTQCSHPYQPANTAIFADAPAEPLSSNPYHGRPPVELERQPTVRMHPVSLHAPQGGNEVFEITRRGKTIAGVLHSKDEEAVTA